MKGTWKSVTGTFTVPTPSGSSGAASAWVGIDGDTCGNAILQTGVDFTISNGAVSYDGKPVLLFHVACQTYYVLYSMV